MIQDDRPIAPGPNAPQAESPLSPAAPPVALVKTGTSPGGRRLLVEIVVLYGAMLFVNLLLAPRQWGFPGIQPHPYLLVVALIAGRYGLAPGVATALVGCFLYEALGAIHVGSTPLVGAPPNPLDLPHSGILAAMLIGSGILGSLYDALHLELRTTRTNYEDAEARARTLATKNDLLETANRELRSKIMGETQTIESLYEMAQRLTTLQGDALAPAALDLVATQTGAEECHFFLVEGNVLTLMSRRGAGTGQEPPRRSLPTDGLVARALRDRRLITVRELGMGESGMPVHSEDPIAAAPLVSPQGDRVLGLITVDRLPFMRFTPQTVRVLGVIADWTARAMSNVALFSNAEERSALEERALNDLVERLRRHTLTRRDLDYLEALAGSMSSQLMRALHSAREDMTIRSNALLVLDRISDQLTAEDLESLKEFSKRELDWLLRVCFERAYLERQPEKEALSVLRFYVGQQVKAMATQILTAAIITTHLEKGVDSEVLRRALNPLLSFDPELEQAREKALQELARHVSPEFATLFAYVVRDDVPGLLEYNRQVLGFPILPLKDFLLGLLGRRDRWLVCASLHAMGELGWSAFRAEVARLTGDPDRYVRETALATVVRLHGDALPPEVRDQVVAAVQDPDAYVRYVAREIIADWQR